MHGIVSVGSTNPAKVEAVQDGLCRWYPDLSLQAQPVDVDSGVDPQPRSMREIVQGAKQRAERARNGAGVGIGLEGGIFRIEHPLPVAMQVCGCVVVLDGGRSFVGLSPGFPLPEPVSERVFEHGEDLDTAFLKAGLTTEPRIGRQGGAIGVLSEGRILRREFMSRAVEMALIGADSWLREYFGSFRPS